MAFIRYVPEANLRPQERVADPDNIIQIHAVHPAVMRDHYRLYRTVMHDAGPLPRREREMIAVRVSALNRCHY
jgi:alkylhydroperoxidase family enzyme